jgi:hypothetical protein
VTRKRLLLVGLDVEMKMDPGVVIENRGLCSPEVEPTRAAAPLYDYDAIVIHPVSYSHFIFGTASAYSSSHNELPALKAENRSYDIDTIFE